MSETRVRPECGWCPLLLRATRIFISSCLMRSRDRIAEPGAFRTRCCEPLGIRLALGIFGVESEKPQDPKEIFADACMRVADETNPSRFEVRHAACVVVDLSVETKRHGVDREVAAQGVGGEIAAEMHDSAAAVGLHVFTQRRDLERLTLDDRQ